MHDPKTSVTLGVVDHHGSGDAWPHVTLPESRQSSHEEVIKINISVNIVVTSCLIHNISGVRLRLNIWGYSLYKLPYL